MSDFAPDARPAFTKFKARRNIAKGFKWDSDKGKLVKTAHGQLFDGEAKRLTLKSAAELVDLLVNNTPREALCWGVSPYDDAFVTTANKLPSEIRPNGKKPTISRTREFFSYPKQPGVMMFDVDPPKDGSAAPLTLDQAVSTLVDCCPPSDQTPMVCACSSSSHVWCNGEEKMGDRGFHVYLFVQDASDIPRAGKVMFARSWLKGYGRIEIGRAGQLLERSFIDGAVWQPERLDFGMKAHCVTPVEQRQPRPFAINTGGPFLDTRAALPDLTPTEETEFKRLVARAKKDREAEAAPIREAWAKDRARDILRDRKTTPEKSPDEFKRLVDSLRSASSSLTLNADIILHTPHGATVTVGEIMADPEKWRGQRFADPLEPDYGGDRRIAYLSEKGGKWGIYSHAHGGVRYALPGQRQAEPERIEAEQDKATHDATAAPEPERKVSAMDRLRAMKVQKEYVNMLGKEKWLFPNLVIKGQILTVIAMSGGGKSTIFMEHVLPHIIEKHDMNVMYLDCDSPADDHKRIDARVSEIGERFEWINPLTHTKPAEHLTSILRDIVADGQRLDDTVFVLDTLKKFTDMLNKRDVKAFFELMRQLSTLGATVILLGHANKYRDKAGCLVFEGVGDVKSDTDAMIFFERMKSADGGQDVTTVVDPDKGAKVRGIYKQVSFHIDQARVVTLNKNIVPVPDYSDASDTKIRRSTDEIYEQLREYLADQAEPVNQKQITDALQGPGVSYSALRKVLTTCPLESDAMPGQVFVRAGVAFNAKFYGVRR